MLKEIKARNAAAVIIKEQSCIGRDIIEAGLLKRVFGRISCALHRGRYSRCCYPV